MKMIQTKKHPQSIEEIRSHNDMVDWLTRAVNAGVITLDKNDALPSRYEEPETEVACPVCQEKDLSNLALLYYEKVYRAFTGLTPGGRVYVGDYNDPCNLDEEDPREKDLTGYFIHCESCTKVSRVPEHIKLEW